MVSEVKSLSISLGSGGVRRELLSLPETAGVVALRVQGSFIGQTFATSIGRKGNVL